MAKKSTSKTGAKKKTVAKKMAALKQPTNAAKKPAATTKAKHRKPAKQSILKRKFDVWIPETIFAVLPDTAYENNFSAPPVIAEGETDFERLKKLLLRPATLEVPEEKKAKQTPTPKMPVEKKSETQSEKKKDEPPRASSKKENAEKSDADVAAKTPAIPIKKLLMQRFNAWTPESGIPPVTVSNENAVFTAPPAIEVADPDHAARLQALLLKKIDFTTPVEPFVVPVEEDTKSEGTPDPEATEPVPEIIAQPEMDTVSPQDEAELEPEAISKPEATPEPEPVPEPEAVPEPAVETEPETTSVPEPMPLPEPDDVPSEIPPAADRPESISIPGPLKALIGFAAVIIALLVTASLMNIRHYYLVPTKIGIEIWKGNFTPNGKENIAFLPLAKAPEKIKDVYTKSEAYDLIYWYNMKQAGILTRSNRLSDLKKAKTSVDTARAYAQSAEDLDRAVKQLGRINLKIKGISPAPGKK